jgi:hypothetical protein
MAAIEYQFGNDLDLDQVIELYKASTLGERRPVDDRRIMSEMMRHANLVITPGTETYWSVSRARLPTSVTSAIWPISPCGNHISAEASA